MMILFQLANRCSMNGTKELNELNPPNRGARKPRVPARGTHASWALQSGRSAPTGPPNCGVPRVRGHVHQVLHMLNVKLCYGALDIHTEPSPQQKVSTWRKPWGFRLKVAFRGFWSLCVVLLLFFQTATATVSWRAWGSMVSSFISTTTTIDRQCVCSCVSLSTRF